MRIVCLFLALLLGADFAVAQDRYQMMEWVREHIAAKRRGDLGRAHSFALLLATHDKSPYWRALVGDNYWFGQGVGRDPEQAVLWFRSAARDGSAYGMSRLASAHFHGLGAERSVEAAKHWLEGAAERFLPDAHFELALHYLHGTAGPADSLKAQRHLEQGLELAIWYESNSAVNQRKRLSPTGLAYAYAGDTLACPRAAPAHLVLALRYWFRAAQEGHRGGWTRLRRLARFIVFRSPLCERS